MADRDPITWLRELEAAAPELLAVVEAARRARAECKRQAPWQPYLALGALAAALDALDAAAERARSER